MITSLHFIVKKWMMGGIIWWKWTTDYSTVFNLWSQYWHDMQCKKVEKEGKNRIMKWVSKRRKLKTSQSSFESEESHTTTLFFDSSDSIHSFDSRSSNLNLTTRNSLARSQQRRRRTENREAMKTVQLQTLQNTNNSSSWSIQFNSIQFNSIQFNSLLLL